MNGIVAIVGRPNVGKSTLFNRLIEQRKSIVHDEPGVTRDRIFGTCEWNGHRFIIIDTGGYIPESSDVFAAAIREQVEIALDQADIVLFVVDVKEGLNASDYDIADIIRRHKKKNVIVVANKVDNYQRDLLAGEFYALGIEQIFSVSGMNGLGTGDLMDAVVEMLPENHLEEAIDPNIPKVAIVGKPNVGKSSLVNALLGRTVNIVTPIAGTTRDSLYTRYNAFGFDYYLVDTAGLRKRAKVHDNIEFFSTIRTVRAIEECDIAILMLDANDGILAQDLHILSLIVKFRKGLVILVNKWDTVEKTPNFDKEFKKVIQNKLKPLMHVPIIFISATEKLRIFKAMEAVNLVYKEKSKHIPTRELNEKILPYVTKNPPQGARGKIVRIKHLQQVQSHSPTFVVFATHPKLISVSYRRFLKKALYHEFGFWGWNLGLKFKET
jgi:GTP-binding protein